MTRKLIGYEDALTLMRPAIAAVAERESVLLPDALGRILAADLIAVEPNPRFDNSAVDGYAVGSPDDGAKGSRLKVLGSLGAGGDGDAPAPGGTLRILTGARVPTGTYGITMQEDVALDGDFVTLRETIRAGGHIRRQGAEFQAGDVLLRTGTRLSPGAAALFAWQGLDSVTVFRRPRVAILTTGDELAGPGEALSGSAIRDSNGPTLFAQASSAGAEALSFGRVPDSMEALLSRLREALDVADLVIVAGGASVGDRDHVPAAAATLGSVVFHGVSIRPGKPVLFGVASATPVFGLPGNPGGAFVCFEIFVREAIRRLAGDSGAAPEWIPMDFRSEHKAVDRDDFVRARLVDGVLEPLGTQASFGLRSLADAGWIVRVPAGETGRDVSRRLGIQIL